MQNLPLLGLVAILAIAGLEAFAIHSGIDGTVLAGALALIAGIAGYIMPSPLQKKPPE